MRVSESYNLKIEEASLTGESLFVEINAVFILDAAIPLEDRQNSAFMETVITYGRGRGMVTDTGMQTQIALIAEVLQVSRVEEPPSKRNWGHWEDPWGSFALPFAGSFSFMASFAIRI